YQPGGAVDRFFLLVEPILSVVLRIGTFQLLTFGQSINGKSFRQLEYGSIHFLKRVRKMIIQLAVFAPGEPGSVKFIDSWAEEHFAARHKFRYFFNRHSQLGSVNAGNLFFLKLEIVRL